MSVYVEALYSLFALACGAAFACGPWQWYCTDKARDRLFEYRNQLFDLAVDGKLDFESYEYRLIRSHIENMIRFAHQATWTRFLILAFSMKRIGISLTFNVIQEKINLIQDASVRSNVQHIYNSAARELLLMIVAKSLFLSILIRIVVPLGRYVTYVHSKLSIAKNVGVSFTSNGLSATYDTMSMTIHNEADAF